MEGSDVISKSRREWYNAADKQHCVVSVTFSDHIPPVSRSSHYLSLNISEMAKDMGIVALLIGTYTLLNSVISNDLE